MELQSAWVNCMDKEWFLIKILASKFSHNNILGNTRKLVKDLFNFSKKQAKLNVDVELFLLQTVSRYVEKKSSAWRSSKFERVVSSQHDVNTSWSLKAKLWDLTIRSFLLQPRVIFSNATQSLFLQTCAAYNNLFLYRSRIWKSAAHFQIALLSLFQGSKLFI